MHCNRKETLWENVFISMNVFQHVRTFGACNMQHQRRGQKLQDFDFLDYFAVLFIFKKEMDNVFPRNFCLSWMVFGMDPQVRHYYPLVKEVCFLKQRANFCSQIIIFFYLNTDFGVGMRMTTFFSGNGCVLLDSPTLWAFVFRQLWMDPCWAFEG